MKHGTKGRLSWALLFGACLVTLAAQIAEGAWRLFSRPSR